MNASQTIFIEQIKAAFAFNLFPLRLDNSTEITAGDITTGDQNPFKSFLYLKAGLAIFFINTFCYCA